MDGVIESDRPSVASDYIDVDEIASMVGRCRLTLSNPH